jgi:hypothetical protein
MVMMTGPAQRVVYRPMRGPDNLPSNDPTINHGAATVPPHDLCSGNASTSKSAAFDLLSLLSWQIQQNKR